ncbi:MAG: AAA-associated domain-containing protein, partial [Chloroflexota bacterium]
YRTQFASTLTMALGVALINRLLWNFSAEEAESQLQTAINWGRYAELYAYDEDSGNLFVEAAPS